MSAGAAGGSTGDPGTDAVRLLPADLRARYRELLARWVALPSVAAEGRAQQATADTVAEELRALGLDVEVHGTAGAPVVFAEKRVAGAPTVLFYNHYDVQPADPLELWTADPFVLDEREGKLFGRGATDDKGQLASRVVALEWLKRRHGGELPVGVLFVVEGEEEVGSPNMGAYVEAHRERLRADACVWEFGGVDARDRPHLISGLKGIVTVDLHVRTGAFDQHSGLGPVVPNAAWRMAAAVASLRDAEGRALVAGFYDRVRPATAAEAAYVAATPRDDDVVAEQIGVERFLGDATGAEWQRRLQLEPVINVNGIHSGYGGPGMKTVLPVEASAKLDVRLVPDQAPDEIFGLLRTHLDHHGFGDVVATLAERPEHPSRVDPTHPWVQHAAAALEEAYGTPAVVAVSSGGSGPLHPFVDVLGLPVIMIGVGYAQGRAHAPDENVRWVDVERGTYATVRTIERWAGLEAPA
ncbi:MAG: M20/M25/M40 family metallo-hydrolase [Trueperaceae bacterium]|nr:M20/M25/M40 family metallo-hydrolase [Trueperaceae bacterium]